MKTKTKIIVPILGIASIVVMLLVLTVLFFVDSTLLYTTLIASFTAFCVLLPLNFFLNKN